MNEREARRNELNLTQPDAATRAGVSLATWRRWEGDPDSVSKKTRVACEGVLNRESEFERSLAKSATAINEAWADSPYLTPRQAHSIACELDLWVDLWMHEWLQDPTEPLHRISPFDHFDIRVMMLVGENRAWVEAVAQRCRHLSAMLESGELPFDRPGPFIDEVLIGATLYGAKDRLDDLPELFERITPRPAYDEDGDYLMGDDDWDLVASGFVDRCQWGEWQVPLLTGHPLLPAVLAERHPFRWFDEETPTGPGYLQRLVGTIVNG